MKAIKQKILQPAANAANQAVKTATKVERRIEKAAVAAERRVEAVARQVVAAAASTAATKTEKKLGEIKTTALQMGQNQSVGRVGSQSGEPKNPAVFKRTQYVLDVSGSVLWTRQQATSISIASSILFPTIIGVAPYFEMYSIKFLRFRFESTTSDYASGGVLGDYQMAIMYDIDDTILASEQALLNYDGVIVKKPTENGYLKFDPKRAMFVKMYVSHSAEPELTSHGYFILATHGQSSNAVIGRLYVDIEVHFFIPRLPDPISIFPRYGQILSYSANSGVVAGSLPSNIGFVDCSVGARNPGMPLATLSAATISGHGAWLLTLNYVGRYVINFTSVLTDPTTSASYTVGNFAFGSSISGADAYINFGNAYAGAWNTVYTSSNDRAVKAECSVYVLNDLVAPTIAFDLTRTTTSSTATGYRMWITIFCMGTSNATFGNASTGLVKPAENQEEVDNLKRQLTDMKKNQEYMMEALRMLREPTDTSASRVVDVTRVYGEPRPSGQAWSSSSSSMSARM